MLQYTVSVGIPNLKYEIIPTHRISITDGGLILHFYYAAEQKSYRQFDESEDRELLELEFAKAIELGPGHFEPLAIDAKTAYSLQRVGDDEFILKALN